MEKVSISILTPTYNRGYLLERLYNSLLNQTCADFEWIVVNDGSTDESEMIIAAFIRENKLKISYFNKPNGGKHTALNLGVQKAEGELTFIVDSDDYLPDNSIQTILDAWQNIPLNERKSYAGIGGLRGTFDYKLIGTSFSDNPDDYLDVDYAQFRNQYKIQGDKAEVYRTDLLLKYPLPVFEGERFMTEAFLWNAIASDGYPLRWINKIVYLCEYLDDGLSANIFEMLVKSPRGYAHFHNYAQCLDHPFRIKLAHSYNYYTYAFIAHQSVFSCIKEDKKKILALLGLPLGMINYIWNYKKNGKYVSKSNK